MGLWLILPEVQSGWSIIKVKQKHDFPCITFLKQPSNLRKKNFSLDFAAVVMQVGNFQKKYHDIQAMVFDTKVSNN